MDGRLEAAYHMLENLGAADMPHEGGRTLLAHTVGVFKLLHHQGESDDVCLAGLCHSIYGTQYYNSSATDDRELVKSVIGEKAERLAWLYCNLDREKFWEFYGQGMKPTVDGEMISVTLEEENGLFLMVEANNSERIVSGEAVHWEVNEKFYPGPKKRSPFGGYK